MLIIIFSIIKWNLKDCSIFFLNFFAIWDFDFVTNGEIEYQTLV